MCQQGDVEITYYRRREARQLRGEYEQHKSGEKVLNEEQLRDLLIRYIMAREE